MAILTSGMTFKAIHAASTTGTNIANTGWSPTKAASHPADLRLTHRAQQPIASHHLLDQRFALWTLHHILIGQNLAQRFAVLFPLVVLDAR